MGVGGAAYTFSAFTNYVVAGELQGVLRTRRMLNRIQRMRDHYIICGYGRVGRQVVEGLRELVQRTKADELMLTASTYAVADRLTSLDLIAGAWR